jgi:hypothetical protein
MAIDRDDKIALGFIAAITVAVTLGILIAIRWLFAGLFGIIDLDTGGIGWRTAFWSAIVLSFLFIAAFALIAGDGVIGEFGFMIAAFFVMVLFFTVSIAVIL